jgi:hypothetical protein
MFEIFKTFEKEWYLVLAIILILIPFNPTNIFVEVILDPFIRGIIGFAGPLSWAAEFLPFVIRAVLAVAEAELLIKLWKLFVR